MWAGSHIYRLTLWRKHIQPFNSKCLSLHLSLSTYFYLLQVQFKTSLHLKLFATLTIQIQQNIIVLTHMHKHNCILAHFACQWNTSGTSLNTFISVTGPCALTSKAKVVFMRHKSMYSGVFHHTLLSHLFP